MDQQYIEGEQTIQKYFKRQSYVSQLKEAMIRHYSMIKNPSIVMTSIDQVTQHNKQYIVIDANNKSGRTMASVITLLNKFMEYLEKNKVDEEQGFFLLIISANRDASNNIQIICNNLIEVWNTDKQEIQVVNVNQFFPINQKSKQPNIILPSLSTPTILLATPATFQKLLQVAPLQPQAVAFLMIDDLNLISIYGGFEQVKDISSWLFNNRKNNKININIFIGKETDVQAITNKKVSIVKLETDDAQLEDDADQIDELEKPKNTNQNNYYYYVSKDIVQEFIVVYVTLKLNLLQGKTLILVESLEQLYQYQLFFQRCNFPNFQIYNYENPKSLKYYILSTFNTGVLQLLIATPEIFNDMQNEFVERQKTKRTKSKKEVYSFKRLDNIISVNLSPYTIDYQSNMSGIGCVLCILSQQNEEHMETLISWMNNLRVSSETNVKSYPLKIEEIEAFRYRIEDVVKNISKHQVKLQQQIDFKQKILKSQDLKEYFLQNTKEKELLQSEIIKIKQKLNQFSITLPNGPIPEYLLPEIIKHQRKTEQGNQNSKTRILVNQNEQNNEKQKLKRKLLGQNSNDLLPKDNDEEDDIEEDDVSKKQFQSKDHYITVDETKEDPLLEDPMYLRPTSSRKLWKLNHGFKLKKRNKRMERKGVFTT